jgi:SAM-dependent methyltransferase
MMNDSTIERLNDINRAFYETTAQEFDQTRGTAWQGWVVLKDYLSAPLSVLDIGCGNGRFGLFLAETFSETITYHGIDNNSALLDFARIAFSDVPNLDATLSEKDIITSGIDSSETYDLVALFGVIHHIPGYDNRQQFIKQIAPRVNPNGLLCFASWRFYEYERFRKRLMDWSDDIEVEKHDYLLDWRRGERALRYCHYVDDDEQNALIEASSLKEIVTYRADGSDNRMNTYTLLKRDK